MTDCKGAFGGRLRGRRGGANIALAQFAGGKVKNNKKPSAGITGAKAGGKTIQIVGYGCGDDTPATILKETRRLMQQAKADVMVGPLSGDEAVAVANWAKARPTKTVIIGTAGSQDPTLQIAPKNVFRYHGDGAQWNAGIGEIVYKKLGWRKAAIIMDDYSFGWTSAAGIIADFCAIGGEITKRVFPPLNTTDYSSYVRQLPPPGQVDGYFWVVGGTGTGPALKAFEQAYGTHQAEAALGEPVLLVPDGLPGRRTAPRRLVRRRVRHRAGPEVEGGGLNTTPSRRRRTRGSPTPTSTTASSTTTTRRRRRSSHGLNKSAGAAGAALQNALPRTLSAPFNISNSGNVKLDANRQAIQDQWPVQIVKGAERPDGHADRLRAERRPVVRRAVQEDEPAARPHAASVREEEAAVAGQDPGREERRRHQHGHQVGGSDRTQHRSVEHAAPTLRLRGVGRRFGGLLAVREVDLDVAQGERRAVLGPNGAGKTTLFNLICGDMPASSGTIELYGEDVTRSPARARVKLGLARTYQQSRQFLGLTVEDSIYLSIVGVEGGRLRPVMLRA